MEKFFEQTTKALAKRLDIILPIREKKLEKNRKMAALLKPGLAKDFRDLYGK